MSETMSNTPRSNAPRSNAPRSNDRPQRKVFFATEARRGHTTTEFFLTIAAAATVVVAAYASKTGSGSFPIRWGWLFFTIIIAAYVVSRGLAKAGSSDAEERDFPFDGDR